MTDTFEAIMEQKKDAILKVMAGLQELCGQPVLGVPPDAELRKCTGSELIYLITLKEQSNALELHAKVVLDTVFNRNSRVQTTQQIMTHLEKLNTSRGGASFGW